MGEEDDENEEEEEEGQRPVHLCVHSHKERGLLSTVVSHTRFPHVIPGDVIVTEDSFSALGEPRGSLGSQAWTSTIYVPFTFNLCRKILRLLLLGLLFLAGGARHFPSRTPPFPPLLRRPCCCRYISS